MQLHQTYTATATVTTDKLACNVGSGDLQVLATPMMMALMEHAAMQCVAADLEPDQTTVGGHIESSHLHPTGLGQTFTATAELTAIEGRKLTFSITASDATGTIGEGTHLRFIVQRERFMSKVNQT